MEDLKRLFSLSIALAVSIMFVSSIILPVTNNVSATNWEREIIEDEGRPGWWASHAIDSSGYSHISYYDLNDTCLKYSTNKGGEWETTIVDNNGDTGMSTTLRLDSNDNPHIGYYSNEDASIKYARWTGSFWSIEIIDNGSFHPSMVLDSNDYPHFTYGDGMAYRLMYAQWNGTEWNITMAVNNTWVGSGISIALDSLEQPHICYYDVDYEELKYIRWNGSNWLPSVVDSYGNVGQGATLKLDSNDNPHVTYFSEQSGYIKYAKWDGSQWVIESIGEGSGAIGSMELDSQDHPHISYGDYNTSDNPNIFAPVKYAAWDGSSWNIETITTHSTYIYYTCIALDSNDRAKICYTSDDILYFVKAIPNSTPSAPQDLTVAFESDFVALEWKMPVSSGGLPISSYKIYRGTEADGLSLLATISNLSYNDTAISNGQTYFYEIRAINSLGEGPRSDIKNATPVSKPLSPQNLQTSFGLDHINITWEPPTNANASAIDSYYIYRWGYTGNTPVLAKMTSDLWYNDTNVITGANYNYKITAVNYLFEGNYSTTISAIPCVLPSAPLNLTVASENMTMVLVWDEPSYIGGSEIIQYNLYRGNSSGNEEFLVTLYRVHEYVDESIDEDNLYYYRVSAVNAGGESPLSNEAFATSPILSNDTDDDGLNDTWEIEYFGDLDELGTDDYDDDNYTNEQEFQAETDPTDPLDHPTNDTINGDDDNETPGFGFELILLATVIGCIFYRRKHR